MEQVDTHTVMQIKSAIPNLERSLWKLPQDVPKTQIQAGRDMMKWESSGGSRRQGGGGKRGDSGELL